MDFQIEQFKQLQKEQVKEYLQNGWQVTPIKFKDKKPILNNWQETDLTQKDINKYFFNGSTHNVGIRLGSVSKDLVDIDLDCNEALQIAGLFLPVTRIFGRERKKASHRLYYSIAKKTVRYSFSGKTLLELRATGQTVFPPSIHVSGELIQWENNFSIKQISPFELYRITGKMASAIALSKFWYQGTRQDISLCLSKLLLQASWEKEEIGKFFEAICLLAGDPDVKQRISGLYATDKKLKDNRQVWGIPKLKELTSIECVDKVMEWLQIKGGKVTEKLPEKEKKNITEDITPFSYITILNTAGNLEDNAVVPYLFYREGISMIFGDPGTGKTWLMMDAVISIVEGKKIWGRYNCEPHKVLLFEGDFGKVMLKHRLKNFYIGNTGITNFFALTREEFEKKGYEASLDMEEGKKNLESFIQSIKPDFLVIDSLCSFMDGDESKSDVVKPIITYLRTLSQKYKIHIMIVHHSRKRTSLDRMGRKLDQSDMIGSSLFQRKVDSLFAVNPIYENDEKLENKGLLVDVKRWLKYQVKFEYEIKDNSSGNAEMLYTYENLTSSIPKKQKAKEMIFNILFFDKDPKSKKQLITLTQINFRTVEEALKQLIEEDKIETIGKTQDRKYRIKSNISNSNMDLENSSNCIERCENNEQTHIYKENNSNTMNVRNMLEINKNNSNIILTYPMNELNPVITPLSEHSHINYISEVNCEKDMLEIKYKDDPDWMEHIPF